MLSQVSRDFTCPSTTKDTNRWNILWQNARTQPIQDSFDRGQMAQLQLLFEAT
jgi:hypothetical protein